MLVAFANMQSVWVLFIVLLLCVVTVLVIRLVTCLLLSFFILFFFLFFPSTHVSSSTSHVRHWLSRCGVVTIFDHSPDWVGNHTVCISVLEASEICGLAYHKKNHWPLLFSLPQEVQETVSYAYFPKSQRSFHYSAEHTFISYTLVKK